MDSKPTDTCIVCGRQASERCSRCKTGAFDPVCFKLIWPAHAYVCKPNQGDAFVLPRLNKNEVDALLSTSGWQYCTQNDQQTFLSFPQRLQRLNLLRGASYEDTIRGLAVESSQAYEPRRFALLALCHARIAYKARMPPSLAIENLSIGRKAWHFAAAHIAVAVREIMDPSQGCDPPVHLFETLFPFFRAALFASVLDFGARDSPHFGYGGGSDDYTRDRTLHAWSRARSVLLDLPLPDKLKQMLLVEVNKKWD
ncbi:hypothetical protein JCM10213_003896 [Rhodosporidiobolus nylandii]